MLFTKYLIKWKHIVRISWNFQFLLHLISSTELLVKIVFIIVQCIFQFLNCNSDCSLSWYLLPLIHFLQNIICTSMEKYFKTINIQRGKMYIQHQMYILKEYTLLYSDSISIFLWHKPEDINNKKKVISKISLNSD